MARISHDTDKKIQQENTSSPPDYIQGGDSGILTEEVFRGTLLQGEKKQFIGEHI